MARLLMVLTLILALLHTNGDAAPITTSFSGGRGVYKGMQREFVNGHNALRARYGVPPVTWSNKLALYARRWSNAMRKDCKALHSGAIYGESIFVGRNGWQATATDAMQMWEAEENIFDRNTGNCTDGRDFQECGHFALMVHKDHQRLGCGRAECFDGKSVFITCEYYFNLTVPAAAQLP